MAKSSCGIFELHFIKMEQFLAYRLCLRVKRSLNFKNCVQVPGTDQHYLFITPDQDIVFPSVSYMRNLINKAAVKQGSSNLAVVINCLHVSQTDFTAAEAFRAMIEDFKKRDQSVYWLAINSNVIRTLRAVTGQDLKIIAGPIELAGHLPAVPSSSSSGHKISKDSDMGTILEETPYLEVTDAENVNKTLMPLNVPKSFATFY